MWRPAHGATTRPGPARPASGYGRAVGCPAPRRDGPIPLHADPVVDVAGVLEVEALVASSEPVRAVEPEAGAGRGTEAAPVTP
jgi:hypothetical protein